MIRNRTVDICKGIGILAMIIGHLNFPYCSFIYSFHMPLFFILAGYFYRPKRICNGVRNDFYRLIVPYIVFASIFVLKFTVTKGLIGGGNFTLTSYSIIALWAKGEMTNSDLAFGEISSVGAIWFLPAMFWCKTVYNIIYSTCHSIVVRILILTVFSLMSIYLFNNVVILPFGLLTGCSALLFYSIGHLAQCVEVNRIKPLMIFCFILSWVCAFLFSKMSMSSCRYDFLPLNYTGACGGTLAIYLLSSFLDKRLELLSKGLAWCGRYSMAILCFHFVNAIIDIEKRLGTNDWLLMLIVQMIIIVPAVLICCRIEITRKLFAIK